MISESTKPLFCVELLIPVISCFWRWHEQGRNMCAIISSLTTIPIALPTTFLTKILTKNCTIFPSNTSTFEPTNRPTKIPSVDPTISLTSQPTPNCGQIDYLQISDCTDKQWYAPTKLDNVVACKEYSTEGGGCESHTLPQHLSNTIQQPINVIILSHVLILIVRQHVNLKIHTVLNWTLAWRTKTGSPTNMERGKYSMD